MGAVFDDDGVGSRVGTGRDVEYYFLVGGGLDDCLLTAYLYCYFLVGVG